MKKLSNEMNIKECNEHIEEILFEEDIILDAGTYLEVYANPDGKYDEESSNGSSHFLNIQREITYGKLLDMFQDLGSVKDNTLTIRTVGEDENQERELCEEHPIY